MTNNPRKETEPGEKETPNPHPEARPVFTFDDRCIEMNEFGTFSFVRPDPFERLKRPLTPKPYAEFSLGLQVDGKGAALPLGLTVLTGETGVGKSELVDAVIGGSKGKFEKINLIEPFDNIDEVTSISTYTHPAGALAHALRAQVVDPRSLTIIDSFRAPLFTTKGAAANKGIIAAFFVLLTNISNSLAVQGRTVVATINPMDDDTEYVTLFNKKMAAAIPSTIIVQAATDRSVYTGTIAVRNSSSPTHRKMRDFTFIAGVHTGGSRIAPRTNPKLKPLAGIKHPSIPTVELVEADNSVGVHPLQTLST